MRAIFFLLAALVLAGCSDNPAGPDLEQSSFTYTAYSSEGDLLLSGTVDLTVSEADSISGLWVIGWTDGADTTTVVGPQVGQGSLMGWLDGRQFDVDFHPGWADNNVLLNGEWSGKNISGRWAYVGFPGVISEGRFEMRESLSGTPILRSPPRLAITIWS